MREAFLRAFSELFAQQTPFVSVTLVEAKGSTPQDAGSRMLVTASGRHWGTVGGGRVEQKALQEAQTLLQQWAPGPCFQRWNLNKDVGMTCGGSVSLFFEPVHVHPWQVVVYGAGHVAQALIPLLLPLDVQVSCLDSRAEWLERLPEASNLHLQEAADLPATVDSISPHAFVLCMTSGHRTDRPILQRFLERGGQAFLGAIGSRAKAATLRRELQENGLTAEQVQSFFCPLGWSVGTNHPQEIAISITAQLLHERDQRAGVEHHRNPLPPSASSSA